MEADIQEIKKDVKQLLVQSAVHNQVLIEHKNFSIALQAEQKIQRAEIDPLKTQSQLLNSLAKILVALFVGFAGQYLVNKALGH